MSVNFFLVSLASVSQTKTITHEQFQKITEYLKKKEQLKQRLQYGELYKRNYYKEVKEKNRIHYELYSLDGTQEVPEDYKEISLVCVRKDGMYLGTDALSNM